jgi:hypothetical protein
VLKDLFPDDTTDEIPTECVESYFSEDFEDYDLGALPNRHPWKYVAKYDSYISADVTDSDYVSGSQSIKVVRINTTEGNVYTFFAASAGCNQGYKPVYIRYYIKYLYEDSLTYTDVHFGTYFATSLNTKTGVGVTPIQTDDESGFNTLYEAGSVQPGKWYRFEIMLNYPEPQDYDVRVYEGESLTDLTGRVDLGNLTARPDLSSDANSEGAILFTYFSQYLNGNPDSDLSLFGFYIDDFAVSDDPSILKAGF